MALTASSIYRESMGSLTLDIVNFASVPTSGDTFTGPAGILACWAVANTAGYTAAPGTYVSVSGTTITLGTGGVVNVPVTLFIAFKG